MKKIIFCLLVLATIPLTIASPIEASANMAQPIPASIGTSVTFEKNEDISVLSEVLDIKVVGGVADISATYTMKNITDVEVTTESMFLTPNIEGDTAKVVVNEVEVSYLKETYYFEEYDPNVTLQDWEYVVLNAEEEKGYYNDVATITFEMVFAPSEQFDVTVSYKYLLGGRPTDNASYRHGEIHYYLTPASMWNGFEKLTINLYLDEYNPIITKSNLSFTKLDVFQYKYSSDTLPDDDLTIEIGRSAISVFLEHGLSPVAWVAIAVVSGVTLLVVGGITITIILVKKKNKSIKTSE